MNKLILSVFGIGYLKKGTDIISIILAIIIGLVVMNFYGISYLLALFFFFSLYGIFASEQYIRKTNEHNPDFIIIDEFIGVWLALMISFSFLDVFKNPVTINNFNEYSTYVLLLFILYFILNQTKPTIIGQIEKDGDGGLSVIGDDLVTGVIVGIFLPIMMGIYYSVLFLMK